MIARRSRMLLGTLTAGGLALGGGLSALAQAPAPVQVPAPVQLPAPATDPTQSLPASEGNVQAQNFVGQISNLISDPTTQTPNSYYDVTWPSNYLTFTSQVKSREEEMLGTTLRPVDHLIRAQIDIPEDRGLIVGGIDPSSPAARVGLKANDILLTLADKPLAKLDDLIEVLKSAREGNHFPLAFLRKGKVETVDVRPVSMITLGPVAKVSTTYIIGVSLNPVDEVLNDQLAGKVQGLVATDVIAGKPAEKAGIKPGDILVSVDAKPLTTVVELTDKLQASKGSPISITYKRRDTLKTVEIKPEIRETEVENASEAWHLYQLGRAVHPQLYSVRSLVQPLPAATVNAYLPTPEATAVGAKPNSGKGPFSKPNTANGNIKPEGARIDALEAQIKALNDAIEELKELLKAKK